MEDSANRAYLPLHGDRLSPDQLLSHFVPASNNDFVNKVTTPLKVLDIDYFLYVRRYSDGSQTELTNSPEWSHHYYKNQFHTLCPFKNNTVIYDEGIYLLSGLAEECPQLIRDKKSLFNISEGICLVRKTQHYNEFFHFNAANDNGNYYLSLLDQFNRYVLYFKDQMYQCNILQQAKYIRLSSPEHDRVNDAYIETLQQKCEYFNKRTDVKRYYLSNENIDAYLTRREIQCMKWVIMGKTAEEIAALLSISKRTVETHLANIKSKLGCYKLAQLGYFYGSNDLDALLSE